MSEVRAYARSADRQREEADDEQEKRRRDVAGTNPLRRAASHVDPSRAGSGSSVPRQPLLHVLVTRLLGGVGEPQGRLVDVAPVVDVSPVRIERPGVDDVRARDQLDGECSTEAAAVPGDEPGGRIDLVDLSRRKPVPRAEVEEERSESSARRLARMGADRLLEDVQHPCPGRVAPPLARQPGEVPRHEVRPFAEDPLACDAVRPVRLERYQPVDRAAELRRRRPVAGLTR